MQWILRKDTLLGPNQVVTVFLKKARNILHQKCKKFKFYIWLEVGLRGQGVIL